MQHVSQITAAWFWVTHSSNMMQSHCALINRSIIPPTDHSASTLQLVAGRRRRGGGVAACGSDQTASQHLKRSSPLRTLLESCFSTHGYMQLNSMLCSPLPSSLSLHEPSWTEDTPRRLFSFAFHAVSWPFLPLHSSTSSSHLWSIKSLSASIFLSFLFHTSPLDSLFPLICFKRVKYTYWNKQLSLERGQNLTDLEVFLQKLLR